MMRPFDRERIAYRVLLFALSVLVVGATLWLFGTAGPGKAITLAGGAILFGGLVMLGWDAGKDAPGAIPADGANGTDDAEVPSSTQPAKAEKRFTIVQTGDDAALDRAADILSDDDRITEIIHESGRWYAVPDRDDLPEWNALRIYCDVPDLDAFMTEVDGILRDRLDAADYSEVSISHY